MAGEKADRAAARALERIPQADRAAFFRLASASGVLRIATAAVAVGQSRRLGPRGGLAAARGRVLALAPRDRELRRARLRLASALEAAGRAPRTGYLALTAARTSIRATDAVNAALTRYSRRHPAVGAAVPD